jgi:heterotetrameric sarcosine oxidase gamma subunit
MSELQPISPLTSAPVLERDFQMSELPGVAKIRVQVLRSRGMNTPCADPQRLPTLPNTALGSNPVVLWKAPDDWLAYSQTLSATQLLEVLRTVSSSAPLVMTDVSAASVVLELRGARAIDILMRDCTLDLEGDAVKPGACAQTALAQVNVMLQRSADGSIWRLFVERSVASHVWDWLVQTAKLS